MYVCLTGINSRGIDAQTPETTRLSRSELRLVSRGEGFLIPGFHTVAIGMFLKWVSLVSSPEKAMAPYSSTLAWKIPWTEEPVGCGPWGR